ncbi:map kinase phosphatase 5 [Chrysochromulina tobinii]|uniref:Map kinase phosphatase 5 n=1 Tax=Chrysochromulina tobinii TaxID=1460289 RepID=A0A0M0JCA3_9EUKA|nr:map kinase phosphatase 5 [Chrysochromulina tobinii]|eukprot:KOO24226.1 map kinase phosphatase 5 [Chrysochromulina sp. CCMP291]
MSATPACRPTLYTRLEAESSFEEVHGVSAFQVALIVLTHGSISREHATLTVSASGSVVVADLGLAQGTKTSGKPLVPNKPHLLPPGSSLTFERSTRTFKLREGGSGFVSGEAGAAAVARAPQSAASLDDLRVQPVLQVLRAGASDCERPRPDGFVRLMSVVASAAVQLFETITEAGVLLLRALDGHEPALRVQPRVQPRLQLVPDPSPPSILFFGFNMCLGIDTVRLRITSFGNTITYP